MSKFVRHAALAALLVTLSAPALAKDYKAGALEIGQPWTRATPKGAAVAGGFMTIRNTGTAPDRLVGGSFEASKRVEVHEMKVDAGGVMRMREIAGGLEIAPGATVELKPGGYHVMFMDLTRQLQQGESVKGTLVFEKAGKVEVEFKAEALAARGASGGHSGHGGMKH
jgi:copper(I)-binding protein